MKPRKRRLALILALVLVLSLGVVPITANAAVTTVSEDFESSPCLLTEISYGSYGEAGNSAGAEYYDAAYGNVWKMYLDGNSSDTYNRVKCSTGETTAYVFGSDTVELTADILVSGSDGGTSSSDTRYAAIVAIISGKKIRLEFNYDDGKIYFGKSPSPGLVELGTFSVDTWYNVRMVLDTVAETCDVYINGTLLGDGLNNLISTTDTTPLLTLLLNDNTDNTSELKSTCYVDNILITDAIYTVNFNSQGGNSVSDIEDVTYDTAITAPDDPTRTGYTFDGWYTDTTYTTPWDFTNDTLTEDMTLYAKWTASDWWIDYRADSFSDEDTVAKTINITSSEELALLTYNVNQEGMDYGGYTITLAGNIDLTGHYWTPIGKNNAPFCGTFNGAGYTISGMEVDTTDRMYAGLFGNVSSGTLTDVTVSGTVTDTMTNYDRDMFIGGLAGYALDTNISSCAVDVELTATQDKTGEVKIGGLVGRIDASSAACGITASSSTGTVTATISSAGLGSINAGGLCGVTKGSSSYAVTVTDSYATGSVDAENLCPVTDNGHQINTGGLVGKQNYASINNCYATGDVTSWSLANIQRCGGLVGYILNDSSVSNAYASGAILPLCALSNSEATYAGSFAGYFESGEISNGYYLYNSSYASIGSKDAAATVTSLTGLMAEQLANDTAVTSTYTEGTSSYSDVNILIVTALNTEATTNNWASWTDGGAYPVFGMQTTYTVAFDSQGGSDVASITDVVSGSTITAPDNPIYYGHTFGGWYKDETCTEAWNFDTDPVTSSMTLYAKWTESDWWIDYPADSFSAEDTTVKTIIIADAEELALLTYNVNQKGMDYSGYTITLAGDIDLTEHYWTPIGKNNAPFCGTFNGAGYTISGMKVDTTDRMYAGLFGNVSSGTLTNVTVSGTVTDTMTNYNRDMFVGGLAGYALDTSISCCSASVSLTAVQNKTGEVKIGGLVGRIDTLSAVCSITSSSATGTITATISSAGLGSINAGGLCGVTKGTSSYIVTVTDSYATGSVTVDNACTTTGNNYQVNTGGLIGKVFSSSINNCYAVGAVTSSCAANTQRCGGLLGYVIESSAVSNIHAYGTPSASNASSNAIYIGSFAGEYDAGTVTNGYYLYSSELSSIGSKGTVTVVSLTGLIAEQLANDAAVTSTYTEGTSSYTDVNQLIVTVLNTEATTNSWASWTDGGAYPVFGVFTVTFDSQGGSDVDSITDVVSGSTIAEPTDPTRSGYTFNGWYTDTSYTTQWDFDTDTVTSSMTLYAKWTANSSGSSSGGSTSTYYTLTFETNGGSDISSVRKLSGTTIDLSGYTPTREGFTFTGWYSDSGLTTAVTSVTLTKSKTVYALWSPDSSADTPSVLNSTDHYKYVLGYVDGTVRPNGNITRAEAVTMIYRLLTAVYRDEVFTSSNDFSDVTSDLWYNKAVSSMANGGYIYGYEDGSFKGENTITRAEFVTILVRLIGTDDSTVDFTDLTTDYWAYKYIATAVNAGWISGYTDGSFMPDQSITRAEAMTIMNRVLHRGIDEESSIPDGIIEWPDNDSAAWYYYEVIEATNDHEYTGTRPSEDWTSLTTDYTYDIAQYENP